MTRRFGLGLLATGFLLAGCGSGGSASREMATPSAPKVLETAIPQPAPVGGGPLVTAVSAAERMVIRTAALKLIVGDAGDYLDRAVAVVEKYGGYVAETRRSRVANLITATATLRIPADKLNAAMQEIKKDAIRVENDAVSGQDVSEEFADIGAQLTNLRATETELRQLLSTVRERTQKASEVLEIFAQLQRVRSDIERIQGRMDYLKQMTAMSTIQLELIPDQLSEPVVEPGWRPMAIVKNAARALVATLKGVAAVLIWIVVYFVPILALGGLLLLVLFWLSRPIRRRLQVPPSRPPAA